MRYLADVHSDFTWLPASARLIRSYQDGDCEVIIKLRNDYWIVGRKSDQVRALMGC